MQCTLGFLQTSQFLLRSKFGIGDRYQFKAAWAFFILLLRFGSLSPSYLIRCPRYTNSGTILSFSSPIVSTFFESFSIICSRFRFLIYSSVRDFVLFRFGFEHAPFLVRCVLRAASVLKGLAHLSHR